jgi:hypothetical protein
MNGRGMPRWFLSYHSPDQALAQRLKAAIEHRDSDSQVFFAPTHMRAGRSWSAQLADEIAQADAFILLIGEKGIGEWQELEYDEALDKWTMFRNKSPDFPLIVVLLKGQTAPGLQFLRRMHWIITPDPSSEKDIGRLFDALAGHGTSPAELWRYTSPYRGLEAMEEKDSDYFFGRQRETGEVLNALATVERLPVLIGNSGVGKSSLAKAGAIAALKRQAWPEQVTAGNSWPGVFKDSRQWCFLSFKPGTDPIKSLVDSFLDVWQFEAEYERVREQKGWTELLLGKGTLSDLIEATERRRAKLDQPKPPAFLLYVDQGEELYVRSEEQQRRRFSELLAQALTNPHLHIMMSLRSDFLGRLQSDKPLFKARQQIDVSPLGEEELREVVSRPAELLGAQFDTDRLVDIITRRAAEESVKDVGALPLLSYTLDDMWTQMVRRGDGKLRIPAQSFELGGVLVNRADNFLATRPGAEYALRRILTLKLATVRENGEPTRRRAPRSEFSEDEWRLVSELADHPNRLLVTATSEAGETYAEVAHEAVFRRWERLRAWIVSERDFLRWKSALDDDYRRWIEAPEGSKNEALLFGLALSQAQEWKAKRAGDLSKADLEFIELSQKREENERRSKDRLRRRAYWIGAAALILLTVFAGDKVRQQRSELADRASIANENFVAAVNSAQRILDRLNYSVSIGDIDAKGANNVLHEAKTILETVQQVNGTLKTTSPFVHLQHTIWDIDMKLENYPDAYTSANKAREATEPLLAANPNNPEVIQLLYSSLWRIGDAIAYRGNDRATQEQALQTYRDAEGLARQMAQMAPRDVGRQRDLIFVRLKMGDEHQMLRDN